VDSGCWAYDNKDSNVVKYGYLYNWETAKTVCPTGWHLPSDAEWTTLTNYLARKSVVKGKMKEITWEFPKDVDAAFESYIKVLPAGYRCCNGTFNFLSVSAFFWSCTSNDSDYAWERSLSSYNARVFRNYSNHTCGYSVRCTKNSLLSRRQSHRK